MKIVGYGTFQMISRWLTTCCRRVVMHFSPGAFSAALLTCCIFCLLFPGMFVLEPVSDAVGSVVMETERRTEAETASAGSCSACRECDNDSEMKNLSPDAAAKQIPDSGKAFHLFSGTRGKTILQNVSQMRAQFRRAHFSGVGICSGEVMSIFHEAKFRETRFPAAAGSFSEQRKNTRPVRAGPVYC